MSSWNPRTLKYAVIERERRFLLREVPDGVGDPTLIEDRYLSGTRLRLRHTVEADGTRTRKFGHKSRPNEASALEVACTSVYLDDGEWEVMSALAGAELVKRRFKVPAVEPAGAVVAIDVFDGALSGLVLAEIDCGEEPDADLRLPFPFVAEVTDDDRFTGAALAWAARPDVVDAAAEYDPTLLAD